MNAASSSPSPEGYAGDVSPAEAWEMLQSSPDARLVDGAGEEVARGTGTFMRSRISLATLPGYRAA